MLPSRTEAQDLLQKHVQDEYQLHHALMVATAMDGYAQKFWEDTDLWYLAGLLHDLDYFEYPEEHPGISLGWFREWNYPEAFIHAVEAHAYGYNGFDTLPETQLAATLMACDEISWIFYAYKQMNPVPYGEMKVKSIKKKFKDKSFAAKINRDDIVLGCEKLEVELWEHIENLIWFFSALD